MTGIIEEMLLRGTSFESTEIEYEYEVYLHKPDFEYIVSNSPLKVLQEQYGVYVPKTEENASSGSVRVRKEYFMVEDRTVYELTVKTKRSDGSDLESTVPISKEMYDQYTLLPDQGMRKLRCVLDLDDDIKLEVDIFETLGGEPVEWIKIDIEMNEGRRLDINGLRDLIPFKYDDIIIVTPESKTSDPALATRVDELYKRYFTIANKHITA